MSKLVCCVGLRWSDYISRFVAELCYKEEGFGAVGCPITWSSVEKPPPPMSSPLSKRKLDDYVDDAHALPQLNPIRMRKDQSALSSSSSSSSSSPRFAAGADASRPRSSVADSTRLQFFVRVLSDQTLVLQADPADTVKSVHEKIQSITGIPIIEQGLIYRGKQLQWEQTLRGSQVQNDASLYLIGRMRSTGHPQAWQRINDVVSSVFHLSKNNSSRPPLLPLPPSKTIKWMLSDFLRKTPQNDDELASGHLQIFCASSAPAALVMLYMSSHNPNRDVADEAIKHFLSSSKSILPRPIYHLCIPIVLEFCRLLNRAAGIDDPLYCLCRTTLGAMLEDLEVGLRKGLIELRDVLPFVSEIAAKLSEDLMLSLESTTSPGPSIDEVSDFTSFIFQVKIAMKRDSEYWGPIKVPLGKEHCNPPMCHADEINFLHGIFQDLLRILQKCLTRVEEYMDLVTTQNGDNLPGGTWHYLALLKELNSISKLYYGCEELFWEAMEKRKDALCYLIVKYAKRSEDHTWVFDRKEVTNFEARRHLAMMMLPEVKDEYEELHEMLIDRTQLLAESFEYVGHVSAESLRAGLFMEFKNEEATGPGVLREWFFLVCQEIFNPQNALFVACPNDRRRFYPNPASKVDPLHLEYFNFSGRVIALALMHKVQVGIVLDRVFFSQLAGHTITLEDVKDADPYLYSSCKQILEMDSEAIDQDALGLTFVYEIEELGTRKLVELCPGGRSIIVNSKNREKYVDSLIQQRFGISIAEQVAHFAQGFADIMNSRQLQTSFFKFLIPEDLDLMLHGSENEISVDDWKAHTEYHGFSETDAQICWFWKIVGQMSTEQKKVLLFFWTSIKYLPVEGFSGLASRLYIYKTTESSDRLPSSHTCFYRLCFPAYASMSTMHNRLSIITQEHVGCSFGTW
ncbi:E3 ubiquitin-protein ligase UPL5 isoform X2 [Andrographis paniculata]|uniref:E3 ubiquitin-protein ligase UPL5 isoform X2 n=1 Tax=Andrographis paniculata TaxID=175694 RepID=UPI0021E71404|nr:E3 ubiquitin-protein ligase UPL5 isoform X2 [Andrographis paniculata]